MSLTIPWASIEFHSHTYCSGMSAVWQESHSPGYHGWIHLPQLGYVGVSVTLENLQRHNKKMQYKFRTIIPCVVLHQLGLCNY